MAFQSNKYMVNPVLSVIDTNLGTYAITNHDAGLLRFTVIENPALISLWKLTWSTAGVNLPLVSLHRKILDNDIWTTTRSSTPLYPFPARAQPLSKKGILIIHLRVPASTTSPANHGACFVHLKLIRLHNLECYFLVFIFFVFCFFADLDFQLSLGLASWWMKFLLPKYAHRDWQWLEIQSFLFIRVCVKRFLSAFLNCFI